MDLKFCQLINFLYNDIEFVEDFLNFYKGFPFPSPGNWWGETHGPQWCEGACSDISWILSSFYEFNKKYIKSGKNGLFFINLLQRQVYCQKK